MAVFISSPATQFSENLNYNMTSYMFKQVTVEDNPAGIRWIKLVI